MPTISVLDHGAKGDGATLDTTAIQAAIDACNAAGGGRVVLPAGHTFVSGTLNLKSFVDFHLEFGAVLQASHDPSHYEAAANVAEYGISESGFLIQAYDIHDCSITGGGAIDGQCMAFLDGHWFDGPWIYKPRDFRVRLVGFFRSNRLTFRDFTIRDAPSWTIHLTGCEDCTIDGIRIYNRLDVPNCDGIDPDHCRNVRISNCHIEAGDDCIVIKTTKPYVDCGPSENITVTNCTLVSTSGALKIGTESASDIRNVIFQGNTISRSSRGITIQLRDGGNVENVLVSDTIVETRRFHHAWWGNAEPIYITALPRDDQTTVGKVKGVTIRGVRAKGEGGIFLAGCEESPLEDIILDDITLDMAATSRWGSGRRDYRPSGGAEHGGLVDDTVAGVHLEHVHGLETERVRVRFHDKPEWMGPALRTEDVRNSDLRGIEQP